MNIEDFFVEGVLNNVNNTYFLNCYINPKTKENNFGVSILDKSTRVERAIGVMTVHRYAVSPGCIAIPLRGTYHEVEELGFRQIISDLEGFLQKEAKEHDVVKCENTQFLSEYRFPPALVSKDTERIDLPDSLYLAEINKPALIVGRPELYAFSDAVFTKEQYESRGRFFAELGSIINS